MKLFCSIQSFRLYLYECEIESKCMYVILFRSFVSFFLFSFIFFLLLFFWRFLLVSVSSAQLLSSQYLLDCFCPLPHSVVMLSVYVWGAFLWCIYLMDVRSFEKYNVCGFWFFLNCFPNFCFGHQSCCFRLLSAGSFSLCVCSCLFSRSLYIARFELLSQKNIFNSWIWTTTSFS